MLSRKKATNLTLDASLIEEARTLDVNLSRAAEEGLRVAVRQARADRWRAENAEALASSNAWVEQHGLPLARYRGILMAQYDVFQNPDGSGYLLDVSKRSAWRAVNQIGHPSVTCVFKRQNQRHASIQLCVSVTSRISW